MRLKLRDRVIGLACVAALLPVLVVLAITVVQKNRVSERVASELDVLARANIAQISRDVYRLCQTTNELTLQQAGRGLAAGQEMLSQSGGAALGQEKASWEVVNELTGLTKTLTLPRILVGQVWLGQNSDPASPSPVVDRIQQLTGADGVLFQRVNKTGDMIAVATTVKDKKGQRALGAFLKAVGSNGKPNPIIAAVLKGETYKGVSPGFGRKSIVACGPVLDAAKETVGMLAASVEIESMTALRKAILQTQVGKTGFVWVVGAKGKDRGHYIISPEGKQDGENIWEAQDFGGRFYVQELIDRTLMAQPGEVTFERYPFAAEGEAAPRMKFAAVTYFAPWDWVVVAGTYEDDYLEVRVNVDTALSHLLLWLTVGGLIILALALAMAIYVGGRIARPISKITAVTQEVARGDLQAAGQALDKLRGGPVPVEPAQAGEEGKSPKKRPRPARRRSLAGDEETSKLLAAVEAMTQSLNSLVGQVQRSGIHVTGSSTQIAASARELEATVSEQAAATNQVSATAKEISATSQELVNTMGDVSQVASETASLADAGRAGLSGMEATMRQLKEDTGSISFKLSVINEKASNINSIVTTITKVADRTNLLSLNAAIEAEKAGEFGLGFSVVAREIRRLADQTAVATLEIEQMVKEMQSAVSSGVMEMDKFAGEVLRSAEDVNRISSQVERIIEEVQALTPRFEAVNEGMRSQSLGARQISESMSQLTETAHQTSESLHEFQRVTAELNEAARGLQNEVSRFKVS